MALLASGPPSVEVGGPAPFPRPLPGVCSCKALRPSHAPRALDRAEGCPTLTNMLVIIVGGIPIAMPTVLSVTLALGAYKLAKEGAIVARMSAVEEMAGMDILCSDKTGARARACAPAVRPVRRCLPVPS